VAGRMEGARVEGAAVVPKKVCRYFLAGECWYGGACRYSHEKAQDTADGRPLCSFFLKGCCMRGDSCSFSHDEAAVLSVYRSKSLPQDAKPQPEGDGVERVMCGICLEELCVLGGVEAADAAKSVKSAKIVSDDTAPAAAPAQEEGEEEIASSTKTASEVEAAAAKGCEEVAPLQQARDCELKTHVASTKFGLLPECNHAFCLKCIQHWRSSGKGGEESEMHRKCPVCRVHSDFVVPSYYYCEGESKKKVIDRYLTSCAKVPCRYFQRSGCCPFRDKCMFGHSAADGTAVTGVKAPPSPKPSKARSVQYLRNMLSLLQEELMEMQDVVMQDEPGNENILGLIDQLAAIEYEF